MKKTSCSDISSFDEFLGRYQMLKRAEYGVIIKSMGVASIRQEEATGICQIKNDKADQLCSLQKN